MRGWFSLNRAMFEHPIFAGHPDRVAVWVWMIGNAAWKETKQDANGKVVTVSRGQILTSLRTMSAATGVSVQSIRTLLDKLKIQHAIKTDTNTGRLLITICNYDKYQSHEDGGNTGGNTPSTHEQHTKEEGNKITIPPSEEASASQPVQVSVLSSAVWNAGKPFLASKGVGNPGGVIGRWLKDHSPMEVLSAIEAAQKAGTEDPVPYITQTLKGGTGSSSSRYREIIARSQT